MNHNKPWLEPDWPASENIHAATTLRIGGASTGAYTSFNLATHVGDDLELVVQNRAILKNSLALPSEPAWLQQIHSNIVVDAQTVNSIPQADASYSTQADVVCVVMTADCLPLLVCDADGSKVAAIHAGWRGLHAGIITKTLQAMACHRPLVWLGPAIGPHCFEVGDDVYQAFMDKSAQFASAFKEQEQQKWLADIYQLARIELQGLGIDSIYGGGLCTMTDSRRFYSYRREPTTGRMATLIWRS